MTWRAALLVGSTGFILMASTIRSQVAVHAQAADERPRLSVRPADDFEVTGNGDHAAWQQANWVTLHRRQPDGHPYDSRFKTVYSSTGLGLSHGRGRTGSSQQP